MTNQRSCTHFAEGSTNPMVEIGLIKLLFDQHSEVLVVVNDPDERGKPRMVAYTKDTKGGALYPYLESLLSQLLQRRDGRSTSEQAALPSSHHP